MIQLGKIYGVTLFRHCAETTQGCESWEMEINEMSTKSKPDFRPWHKDIKPKETATVSLGKGNKLKFRTTKRLEFCGQGIREKLWRAETPPKVCLQVPLSLWSHIKLLMHNAQDNEAWQRTITGRLWAEQRLQRLFCTERCSSLSRFC